MNKQLFSRINPLLAAVVVAGALFVVLFAAYGLTRWASAGEVMGRVSVAEAQVGGRTVDQALNVVTAIEIGRLTRTAHFTVDGRPVELQPGYTGLDVDEEGVVADAMMVGREGNFANQFLHWLTHIFATAEVELLGSVSEMALQEIFDEWDTEVIAKPIVSGGIELTDGELVPVYPATGVGVDREPALDIVLETLLASEDEQTEVPTVTVVPELTDADVDAAFREAQLMLAGPISLTYEDRETVLSQDQLEAAFVSETVTNSPPAIINSFDPAVVDGFITPIRSEFEAEPVNAEFVINDDDTVSVQPGP